MVLFLLSTTILFLISLPTQFFWASKTKTKTKHFILLLFLAQLKQDHLHLKLE